LGDIIELVRLEQAEASMTDILIRKVPWETVAHLDEEAKARGISRSEYIRRLLIGSTAPAAEPEPRRKVTHADWVRSAEAAKDLLDPEIMAQAWR
jgi:hypothetical protein